MPERLLAGLITAAVLAGVAVAGPGEPQCYSRNYDTTHLANHPQQTVTNMWLVLATDDPYLAAAQAKSTFEMGVRLRGRDDWLATGGYCRDENDHVVCSVECDGGGVAIAPSSDGSILVDLEKPFGRIALTDCGGDVSIELAPGIDDKLFRLDAVSCAGAEARSWKAESLTKRQPVYGTTETCELYAAGEIETVMSAPTGKLIIVSPTSARLECGVAYMLDNEGTGGGQIVFDHDQSCSGDREIVMVQRCP